MPQPVLHVDNLCLEYGGQQVINQVSFEIQQQGEICCLLGPSGCGKTTLLRALAGFIAPTQGSISLNGQLLSSPQRQLAPEHRGIGMVFQDYALFPHLTVADNIAFGLQRKTLTERRAIVAELLELIDLEAHGKRYPHELSGGQQQRVALARAIAPNPGVLLLDEPFSNLDVALRARLNHEIKALLKERQISAIFVTHDQQEAFAIADQIGLLNKGELRQWSSPYDLYHQPADVFVANFIGRGHWLDAKVCAPNRLCCELGELNCQLPPQTALTTPFQVLIRPDDLESTEHGDIQASVLNKQFNGASTLYLLQLQSGQQVESQLPSHRNYSIGDTVRLRLAAEHIVAFSRANAALEA